jgi:hypothetical protein
MVGASRSGESRITEFTEGCFWELDTEGRNNPRYMSSFYRIQLKDRIAIKSNNGVNNGITIKAVGIITGVDTELTRVSVNWLNTGSNRVVGLNGCLKAIQKVNENAANVLWFNEVFRI